jgi:murein DD-endopeptidase MepM/ murein hydrolase activator NlpD
MDRKAYEILLYFLRSLIYIKRALFWFLKKIWLLLIKLNDLFKNTLGFRLYKIGFRIQRYTGKLKIPWDSRLIELFGKRSVLQLLLLVVIIIVMIPESRLYSKDTNKIAGHKTLVYQLVGPGDQDFSLEEISANPTNITTAKQTDSWKQGAVSTQPITTALTDNTTTQTDITSIGANGMAVNKPTIIPGASLPGTTVTTGRSEMVSHTVQPGDTIGVIAEKYNISVATILWANDLSVRSYIRPGDELKILPVSGLIHKVSKGDTLLKIASLYDTETEKIIKYNKLKNDGSDIIVGEELLIPDGVKPRPVSTYTPPVQKYTQLSNVVAPPPSVAAPAGSGYLWPTSVRYISQYYGWRHTGLDIAGPVGTPLYASKSGKVIMSQCGYNGGYGCYIIIDHGGGVQTLYGHASKLYVSVGDQVVQGETIAAMGSTGRSTGPHIHFEVRINGSRMNPLKYIR